MSLFTVFTAAALLCILAVTGTLFWGVVTMAKPADKERMKSNKLMRMRVLFQGLALLFLALAYLAR
jgi:hypothetical protein